MSTPTYSPTYEKKGSHPGTSPSATIYLGGLLCLAFDGSSKCTVGVNPADKHKWKLQICERGPNTNTREWHQDDHSAYKDIQIEVTGGTTGPPTGGGMTPARSLRTTFSQSSACSPIAPRSAFSIEKFAVFRRLLWQVTQY